jgi:hypothetical protein
MSLPERCAGDHSRPHSAGAVARACLIAASLAMTAQACARLPAAQPADAAGQPRLSVGYGKLPLSFEVNQGQSDERVKFLARGQGYGIFLTPAEAVLSLRVERPVIHAPVEHAATGRRAEPDAPGQPAVVRMRLVGANRHPELTGLDPLPGTSNYFIGNDPERWQRDVPHYARVKSAGVYPGVDLVYYGNQRQLEYDFVVAPGADPSRIALAFDGVRTLSLDPHGNLVLGTSQGDLVQHKPVIYQDIGGTRRPVVGRYVLRASQRVSFEIARYDTTRPLVIDPVLTYSTYLGGGGNDVGNAIAVDSAGNAYVTGVTDSVDFPGVGAGSIQPMPRGSVDVFVTKINAAGNALVYSTYLGGSLAETGFAIAVDSAGNAYVTGETNSPTAAGPGNIPFPLVGPIQPLYGLGGDVFITKINAAGNALLYSTYLGNTGTDRGTGIAVDGSGNAYVTGQTNGTFPTAAAFQSLNGGSIDAFVTKINAAGSALVYSTYLGGTGSENSVEGGAIAVDTDGNAYVGGSTGSANFPGASTSPIQALYGGDINDGFVVKFNAAGSALLYSTYLGGSGREGVHGIAIDTGRNAYVAGATDSPNFPTAAAMQGLKNGSGTDAFVSKLNAAGSALVYSTYLGGTGAGDIAYAVAVDNSGNAYLSGFTNSSNFPTVAPVQPVNVGLADAFLSMLNAAGSALVYSSYLGGGNGHEHGYGIAVDGSGNAYVTGKTNSTNFPTANPFQSMFGGSGDDAFVTKVGIGPALVPTNVSATATTTTSVTITWTGSAGATSYVILRVDNPNFAVSRQTPDANTTFVDTLIINPNATYLYSVAAVDGSGHLTASSVPDLATTIFFADDPLVALSTAVKATHIVELRTAVNAARFMAGLPSFAFTDGSLASVAIKKTHVEELRTTLNQVRAAVGVPAITYTDPVLTSGVSTIKAAHIEQLRTGVK